MPYLIREIFVAKPGQAGKLAKLFRRVMIGDKTRVMTDMSGPYHTIVVETEVESLAEWERQMNDYKAGKPDPNMDPEAMKEMSNMNDMYVSGKREIWRIQE